MRTDEFIIYQKTIPARCAENVPFPESLSPEIVEFLKTQGISSLYSHQAEMFEAAKEKKNIVITTSTASGKTLSFLLPVMEEILKNPLARAVFVYPTKALASDQYRAIEPYLEYFGQNRISAGVYDGDTTANERSRIRKNANIILTNPEMLNAAFLPNHSKYGFDFIFSNLKFVVIDELHTYRGAFGSHLANVFRRLKRVCRYYHSAPQFLCSSATISNPKELAEKICGHPFMQIERDGSPAAERNYKLIQPPKIVGHDKKYYGQTQVTTVAADMIPELVEEGHSFIAFAKSRRSVEVILKEARDKLETESFFGASEAEKISGYRSGYTPIERKEIEQKMISGALSGLVSTNALELGIDIGKIDTTLLAGYPGTRASFWQQTGRAGRSRRECTNYLILDQLPFDQYIAVNPDWIFGGGCENAVIDPDNLLIELAHIRAAAAEIPLTLDDIALFKDLGETIPILLKVKELTGQGGKFAWSGSTFPAGDFSLRNIDKSRYKLINEENNREVTEMDEMQAFRELHDGAVYLHDGSQYLIRKLDVELKTAYAKPFQGNYYTVAGGNVNIRVIKEQKKQAFGRGNVSFGDVNVEEMVYMYKKLQFHNHQNLGFTPLESPLSKNMDTESAWMRIPTNVVKTFRRLLKPGPNGEMERNNHFEGLCYAIKNAALMATMTEQEDIGVTMSGNASDVQGDLEEEVFVFIYDKYMGGLGFSEKTFEMTEQILNQAIEMVGGCKCEHGCAACIGDFRLDKSVVLWGLKNFFTESEPPKEVRVPEYAPSTYYEKPFRFEELTEKWTEFCEYLKEKGDAFASFLSTIPSVSVEYHTIILRTNHPFYRQWIMEESNKKSLLNIFRFYTEAPADLTLQIGIDGPQDSRSDIREKLQKRYENLTE
ncbi:MAG: DEAD/DEAH box helicase [Lachnospiraceae bacterium]|nr:DEAD/DEAH box helicase [Lachnospiraceae bacterium]